MSGDSKEKKASKKEIKGKIEELLEAYTQLRNLNADQTKNKNTELSEILSIQLLKLSHRIVEETRKYLGIMNRKDTGNG
ncbi:hypothetical protein TRIP_B350165 [uncultured Desulfatiglans sp.]|nr:hypothetical protein TRIP_B350165 [uncultured Desulfatiglans sp.]